MIDFLLTVCTFLGGVALGAWIVKGKAKSIDVKNTLFGHGIKKN